MKKNNWPCCKICLADPLVAEGSLLMTDNTAQEAFKNGAKVF
jgi:hypothetical protein